MRAAGLLSELKQKIVSAESSLFQERAKDEDRIVARGYGF